jgi:hypothetical protein
MSTRTAAAVALVAAAALALEAGVLHAAVAAPLTAAMRAIHGPATGVVFEESITVVAQRRPSKARPAS